MSPLQQKVIDQARVILSEYDWYKGVHVSELPSDAEIELNGIEDAVTEVCLETASWDCPAYPDIQ
jgi:hypothetical protein